MRPLLAILVVISTLVGCASVPESIPAADLERASQVEFMRPYELSRTDVSFTSIGTVRGESCQSPLASEQASQQLAMIRLKLAALEQQGNRVVLKGCFQDSEGSCTQRWSCEGEAYQMNPLR